MCIAVLHKGLTQGFRHAFSMVWGVALIDAFYIMLSVIGVSAVLLTLGTVLAFAFLKEPRRASIQAGDIEWEIASQRAMVAQAAWRGVALRARVAREARNVAPL